MSYVIRETAWPSEKVSDDIKDVIAKFYELADSQDSNAGTKMATEVFTENATLIAPTGTFEGALEISKSREKAWDMITSREHHVLQVFAVDQSCLDLMVRGKANVTLKNGKHLVSAFASHVIINKPGREEGESRIAFLQAFADAAPLVAMSG